MFAGCFFPLTSKKIFVSFFENSFSTYPIATGPLTLGPNVPLVISPICKSDWLNILVFSLAIILPSGFIPTLILLTPSVNCLLIIFDPIKFPLEARSLEIAHLRFASTGVLSLSSSWPYKHKPASSLRVSLAPKPINFAPFSISFFVKFSAQLFGKEISNPSSPV